MTLRIKVQKEAQAVPEVLFQPLRHHRLWLLSLSLLTLTVILWQQIQHRPLWITKGTLSGRALSPQDSEPLDQLLTEALPALPPGDELDQLVDRPLDPASASTGEANSYNHLISKGDSLEGILNQYGIELGDIALLAKQHPLLRRLHVGQNLSWNLDEQGRLKALQWHVSQRETHYFQRVGNLFSRQYRQLTGVWRQQQVSGEIIGNFVSSAGGAGLTQQEIQEVTKALQWQFDFRKLRKGDTYELILSREYLGDKRGQSQLVAARFRHGNRDYYAIRADDGRFYDLNGSGLAKGFLRLPTVKSYPISSKFSPKRRHPITGRYAPHNGVDFAMPSGTIVLTVADGEILQTGYSRSAGYYVVIRHGRQYITRYFHLQKILVNCGQRVRCGEKVALSGNSGSSTGPHLHFEVHINQLPVNPLTVRLPSAAGLVGADRRLFLSKVNDILSALSQPAGI